MFAWRTAVVAAILNKAWSKTWSVAVVISPDFYLLDAMGPLDVFRAAQLRMFEHVNLTSHEFRPGTPGGIVADSKVHAEILAATASPVAASDGVTVTPYVFSNSELERILF